MGDWNQTLIYFVEGMNRELDTIQGQVARIKAARDALMSLIDKPTIMESPVVEVKAGKIYDKHGDQVEAGTTAATPRIPLSEAVMTILAGRGTTGMDFTRLHHTLRSFGYAVDSRGAGGINIALNNGIRKGRLRKNGDAYVVVSR